VIWGTAEEFNAGSTYYIAVSSLSATDFVVAYKDASNSSYGTAITGTVSGGSLSFGTAEVFNAGVSNYIVVEALSPSAFLIAYQDTGNFDYGTAITGTTIGGGLSFGSEEAFNMTTTSHIAVEALSSTDFVIAYRDEGNSDYGTAMTGTLGGGGLSWGSGSVFNAAGTYYVDIASLSATDFVVAYGDAGNSNYGTAILGTVGGSGLSWGSESVFNAASTTQIRISGLAIPDFAVVYNDGGNFSYGTGIVGTVSGGGVDWGAESVFNAAATYWGDVSSLSPTDFVLAYRDDGNSNHGTAIVGHWGRFIGTAKTSASGGETASVIVSGVSDVHSGLVPGAVYFLQGDGSLGLTLTGRRVGLDISASELLLDQLW